MHQLFPDGPVGFDQIPTFTIGGKKYSKFDTSNAADWEAANQKLEGVYATMLRHNLFADKVAMKEVFERWLKR